MLASTPYYSVGKLTGGDRSPAGGGVQPGSGAAGRAGWRAGLGMDDVDSHLDQRSLSIFEIFISQNFLQAYVLGNVLRSLSTYLPK